MHPKMEEPVEGSAVYSPEKQSCAENVQFSEIGGKSPKAQNLSPQSSKHSDSTPARSSTTETHEPSPPAPSIPVSPSAKSNVGKYKLVRTIGKGNFAKVKLAIHMATGVEVAIKIITKKGMDWAANDRLRREVNILQMLNHPNIVRLLEIIENEEVICLVQEYANGGEIFDYLVAHGKMREKEARSKFRQLVSALDYCHSKNIVHRDLKAENILLDAQLNVKVADFGLANIFKPDQKLSTFCGSPPYAAPELFLGIRYHGPGVDIWSMGVLLFTLVVGHLPFDATDLRELRTKILTVRYNLGRGEVSSELQALLKKMLVLDPRDRYSLRAIMNDRWLNMGYDTVMTPYQEPSHVQLNEAYVEQMVRLGFTEVDLMNSVVKPGFDHVYATYALMPEMLKKQSMLTANSRTLKPDFALLNHNIPSIETPSKTASGGSGGPTGKAVGRFTVEPAKAHADNPRRQSGGRSHHLHHQGGAPTAGAPISSNYSATSSLPAALKRALVSMGRSLTGQTSAGSSSTTYSGAAATSGEQSSEPGMPGRHHKSKDPQPRVAVTPAPVPLGSRQKRIIPGATVASPVVNPTNTATGNPTRPAAAAAAINVRPTTAAAATKTTTTTTNPGAAQPAVGAELPGVSVNPVISQMPSASSHQTHASSSSDRHTAERHTATSQEDSTLTPDKSAQESLVVRTAALVVDEVVEGVKDELKESPLQARAAEVVVVEGKNPASSQLAVNPPTPAAAEGRHSADSQRHHHLSQTSSHQSTWTRNFLRVIGSLLQGPSKQASKPTQLIGGSKRQVHSKPREVKSPWGVHVTSNKTAAELMGEMKRALETVKGCRWEADNQWMYLLHCGWSEVLSEDGGSAETPSASTAVASELLQWEMEVCSIPRLHQRAVCLKRIRGSAIQFQKVATQVMAVMTP
uniref:non-specific serine/threonine protein kinase n=1 Tax=Mesocestoides corti TaxID=53468 RepID=A0A5K3FEK1_MESCO